ncbi:MAG: 50S ribosomal protein L11 methyltransferase [Rhodobacteraceae bacterium]|nr:50S ribosomal protein L11 methyltransferase [Paracoccaceae bacterium]
MDIAVNSGPDSVRCFAVLTTLPGQERAEQLAAALENLRPGPVATVVMDLEDGSGIWEVGGYFEERPGSAELALLAAAFGSREFKLSELPDIDWVDKVHRELTPVRAGRFTLQGSHIRDVAELQGVPILVDASMAFGTGHHATTRGCIEVLDALEEEGFEVTAAADIGCGTGVLAIAIAKLWNCRVLASDNDPTAVKIARLNVQANHADHRIQCFAADGLCHDSYRPASLDLITSNILSGPLIGMAAKLTGTLCKDGRMILSGIASERAHMVIEAYRNAGASLIRRQQSGDWVTLLLKR